MHGFNNDYFVVGDAFPINNNAIANCKNRICELAGLPQIRIHDFRHSYSNGTNVTVVAKYLGHTKIGEPFNTYAHLFSSAMNEIVNLIDKLEE